MGRLVAGVGHRRRRDPRGETGVWVRHVDISETTANGRHRSCRKLRCEFRSPLRLCLSSAICNLIVSLNHSICQDFFQGSGLANSYAPRYCQLSWLPRCPCRQLAPRFRRRGCNRLLSSGRRRRRCGGGALSVGCRVRWWRMGGVGIAPGGLCGGTPDVVDLFS